MPSVAEIIGLKTPTPVARQGATIHDSRFAIHANDRKE